MRLLALICIALGLTSTVAAQDTTGTGAVAGRVASEGTPQPFVTVCIAESTRCVVSGDDGTFRLTDLRAGDYRLEITAPGQPPITTEPIDVHAGLTRQVDIAVPSLGRPISAETASH